MTYKSDFLNILNERGFIHQCSDFDALDKKLCEGPQSAYIGFDATATSLHVGSLVQIMMLYWFQQTGHRPVTLMGGGTTKVGDPSGKDESRKMLTNENIKSNIKSIKKIFSKFLEYRNTNNDAIMANNDLWLSKLKYIDFLRDYGTHFTINKMLNFDSVKLRLDRQQPLTFLEFNYMILQAYDFVELYRQHGTILQMGGSDQWGNIINGVELGRRTEKAELFALTTPLLTTASGAKMGKTAQGAVWLNADMLSPYDYYQYWRNTEDDDVGRFLKLFTILPMDEISKLESLKGQEINKAKKILAFEATKLCHGKNAAKQAKEASEKFFAEASISATSSMTATGLKAINVKNERLEKGIQVIDLFIETGLASSKSEVRRLIKGGGAKYNNNIIDDENMFLRTENLTDEGFIKLSSGKKRHALVKVK